MRDLTSAIARHGQSAPVYEEAVTGENDFGQPTKEWAQTDTVLVARSYQNRNTSADSSAGELHRDRPVLFFPREDAPSSGARVKIGGNFYELDSVTKQQTHAVAMGSLVRDFDPES